MNLQSLVIFPVSLFAAYEEISILNRLPRETDVSQKEAPAVLANHRGTERQKVKRIIRKSLPVALCGLYDERKISMCGFQMTFLCLKTKGVDKRHDLTRSYKPCKQKLFLYGECVLLCFVLMWVLLCVFFVG